MNVVESIITMELNEVIAFEYLEDETVDMVVKIHEVNNDKYVVD
ncbi:hypothetical protein [Veillonella sp. ICM51a]|nr:hypothetical protein [Veillonella sp. ICM51a]